MADRRREREHRSIGHPLATGSLRTNLTLVRENRGMGLRFSLRALNILASNLVLLPFRTFERKKWKKEIAAVSIDHPPIFLIGTWRSGTTHLHNILSKDETLGIISTLQAFCPEMCIEFPKVLPPIFQRLLPKRRPMDNVFMDLSFPQEEEYAMGGLTACSFYHGYYFPGRMRSLFDELSFSGGKGNRKTEWEAAYRGVLNKATLMQDRKRLLLKNPMNTVRIPMLLEMFPEAKFIFLVRNPFVVFHSMMRQFTRMITRYQLDEVSESAIEADVFHMYERMLQGYWESKPLIPNGNLVELRFEDLEKDPLREVERIYRTLDLVGFQAAGERMSEYLLSQADYEKNRYTFLPETLDRISLRWKAIIDRLDYSPPPSQ